MSQGWQDDQDGEGFELFDVGTAKINNLISGGVVRAQAATGLLQIGLVTYADIQTVGASRLLGNPTGSPATVSEIPLNAPLFFSGGNVILNYDGTSLALSGGTTLLRAALSGDVAAPAGSNTTTIQPHVVSYAKMQQASAHVLLGNPTAGTADVQEITLGTNLSFSGSVLNATGGGGGSVTNVSGTAPIAVATGTTTPVISLNIDATLAVVSSNLGRATISGDISIPAGINVSVLQNIPNDTTMAGDILATVTAAPGTPAASKTRIYVDSTSKNLAAKNDAGVVNHGIQSKTAVASNWIRSIADDGSSVLSQPAYSDISGTPTLFYQTIQAATVSLTQRPTWNAATGLTAADNSGSTRTDVTVNLSTGVSGGQTAFGDTASGGALTLSSTANATKGIVWIGTGRASNSSHFDEVNTTFQVGGTGAIGSGVKIASYAPVAGGVINLATNDAGVATTAFAASGASLANSALGTSYILARINGLAFTGTSGFDTAQAGLLQLVTTNNAPLNINNLGDGATGGDIVFTSKTTTSELARFKANGDVLVDSLTAGGIVKAAASTGLLGIASATDVAAAILWPAATQVLVSAGTAVAPLGDSTFTFDRVIHVMAGGNAIGINGVSVPTNVNLCVGHTTASNRDRSQFFVGGGSLGPSTAGTDSTLFDVFPSNTTINLGVGVLGGIYATQRIRSLTYPGGGVGCAVSVAASLYIDAAPTLVVASGQPYALYIASGLAHVAGALDSGSAITGHTLAAIGTAGTAFIANGDSGPIVGFFGASPLGQQTGGAASAGGTYTATEQGMLNRAYAALRAYGLLT